MSDCFMAGDHYCLCLRPSFSLGAGAEGSLWALEEILPKGTPVSNSKVVSSHCLCVSGGSCVPQWGQWLCASGGGDRQY